MRYKQRKKVDNKIEEEQSCDYTKQYKDGASASKKKKKKKKEFGF